MINTINIIIGTFILALGFPIGNLLARYTKEELKSGKNWFKLIIFVSFIGALVSLVYLNDAFLFTFLFIIVVTSRSLR